jgi:hypothetical protein
VLLLKVDALVVDTTNGHSVLPFGDWPRRSTAPGLALGRRFSVTAHDRQASMTASRPHCAS